MDCQIYATFCSKTQYATAMTVERQKFRNSKIQDGGRICVERLRMYMLIGCWLIVSTDRGDHLFGSMSDLYLFVTVCKL